jgi:hypothetical protein
MYQVPKKDSFYDKVLNVAIISIAMNLSNYFYKLLCKDFATLFF